MTLRIELTDAATTRELRRQVLRPSWPTGTPMHGDDRSDAIHLAAFDGDRLLGTCLVFPEPYPVHPNAPGAWQLRGMATDSERQGQGVGARVLAAALTEVAGRRGTLVWCEARVSAVRFYAAHGFAVDGPEFAHAQTGAPHHYMWRELSAEPVTS